MSRSRPRTLPMSVNQKPPALSNTRSLGPAVARREDLDLAVGPHPRHCGPVDLDQQDAAVPQRDRALGELQALGQHDDVLQHATGDRLRPPGLSDAVGAHASTFAIAGSMRTWIGRFSPVSARTPSCASSSPKAWLAKRSNGQRPDSSSSMANSIDRSERDTAPRIVSCLFATVSTGIGAMASGPFSPARTTVPLRAAICTASVTELSDIGVQSITMSG